MFHQRLTVVSYHHEIFGEIVFKKIEVLSIIVFPGNRTYRRVTTVPDEFVTIDSGSVVDSLVVVFCVDGGGEYNGNDGTACCGRLRLSGIR